MAVALIVYGGAHWAQMESPALGMRWVFGLAALAILPAIVSAYGHLRLAWLVALPAACVAAVGLVTGLWPWSTHHGFYPRAVAGVLNDGAHSWFTAHTPFDAGRFVAVDTRPQAGVLRPCGDPRVDAHLPRLGPCRSRGRLPALRAPEHGRRHVGGRTARGASSSASRWQRST